MIFKVNDIRPAELMEQKKPALEHDKKFLKDRRNLFVNVNCPACGTSSSKQWGEKEGFTYEQCTNCLTIYMNPRADEHLAGEFYKQSQNYDFWNKYIFPATDAVRKEKIFIPRAQKTVDYCRKYGLTGGTLLEIGAAFGTYCDAIKEQHFFENVIAVEPTPGLAETCRLKGYTTYESTVEELEYPQNSADVVANFEVIEHLSNPKKFIQLAVQFLKPHGLFICTCPNGLALGTLVLKEKAGVVDHEHVNYFNPKSLSHLLENCGLEVLETSTPGELDTDLLIEAFKASPKGKEINDFFLYLVEQAPTDTLSQFQNFLKAAKLSSHLWIVAKKR